MAHRNGGRPLGTSASTSSIAQGRTGVRRRGSTGSDDSGPEVEFRAFLRGASRPAISNAASSASYSANDESRQASQSGRPPPGTRRNGAPRLGGLGLGGVGLVSPPTSPARSKAPSPNRTNYAFPLPPKSSASANSSKRTSSSRESPTELFRAEYFDPSSTSPPTFPSRPPPNPFPDVNSINQRPFLSPEMVKPTLRAAAFALDRPVPDGRSTLTTRGEPPHSSTSPDSPGLEPFAEPTEMNRSREQVDSISSLQEVSQLATANEELFGGLQAMLVGKEVGKEKDEDLGTQGEEELDGEDEKDPVAEAQFPQSVDVDDDLPSPSPPSLSPTFPETPSPPSPAGFASPLHFSTPPPPTSALPRTPDTAPSPVVEATAGAPSGNRGASSFDNVPKDGSSVVAVDRTLTESSATGSTHSSGSATPPVFVDPPLVVQLAEAPQLIVRAEPAFSTFPLVTKIRPVDSRRGSSSSSAQTDDTDGGSFYSEPTRPLDLPSRSSSSRTRGPPPPRPKRLRAPVTAGQAVTAAIGVGGGVDNQRELLVTSEETVDAGEGEAANERTANGGSATRRASSSSGRSFESTRRASYASSSATFVASSPPVPPPMGHPILPSAARLPSRSSPPIDTPHTPPIESSAEAIDPLTSAIPTVDSSPTISSTSTMSVSSGFSEASRESFFFRPPPPRTTNDHGTSAAVALPAPPLVAAPVLAVPEPSSLSQRRGSYHGLGLRLPSSITPSSSSYSASAPPAFTSPIPPPPAAPLPEPTHRGETTDSPLPTSDPLHTPDPLPSSDPLPATSPLPAATPVALKEVTPAVDSEAPNPVLPVLPPAFADTVNSSTRANIDDNNDTLATVAIGVGIAVGYTAWRGLSAAASAGSSWGWDRFSAAAPRTAAGQDDVEETAGSSDVVLPGMFRPITPIDEEGASLSGSDTEEGDTFYHDAEDSDDEAEEEEKEEDGTESSVISTEWGEIHFPAPEGFLDAFKEAMAELGPEDLAANERTEIDAQEAAYLSASRAHQEVVSSPTPSPSRPPPVCVSAPARSLESRKDKRRSTMSIDSSQTLQTHDQSDEDAGPGTMTPRFSTFTTPAGAASSSLASSSRSVLKLRRPTSLAPSTNSTTPKKKKSSFFSFGSKKRAERESSVDSSSSQSLASTVPSSFATLAPVASIDSSVSSSRSKERPKSMIFGDRFSPAPPSVESEIGDATYVSYASGRTAARRGSSTSSGSSATPNAPLPGATPTRSASAPTRRSSLRQQSRFDPNRRRTVSTSLSEESAKTLYTVRFGNATRGLGLRSVAEDEAVKGGGETHAMKWIGVGRGRYGNLTLQTDEASDELYSDQAAQIKKKWRAFGASQARDWANVKID